MSPVVGLYNYLVVGAILFTLGIIGFLARRNLIVMVFDVTLSLYHILCEPSSSS